MSGLKLGVLRERVGCGARGKVLGVQAGQEGSDAALRRALRKQLVGRSSGRDLRDGRAVGVGCPENSPGAASWGRSTGRGMGGFGRCPRSASPGSRI